MVLKQLGAGPELFHCHVTLALEAFMNWAVTLVGVGGAGVVQGYKITEKVARVSTVSEKYWLLLTCHCFENWVESGPASHCVYSLCIFAQSYAYTYIHNYIILWWTKFHAYRVKCTCT